MEVHYANFSKGRAYAIVEKGKIWTWGQILTGLLQPKIQQLFTTLLTMDNRDYFLKLPPLFSLADPCYLLLVWHTFSEPPDWKPFQDQLTKPLINIFPNPDKTTWLVVPTPDKAKNFLNLRHFLLNAQTAQIAAFYQAWVDTAYSFLAQKMPVWINTHGLGVPWLHLRFDQTHKYPDLPFAVNAKLEMAPWLKFGQTIFPALL